MTPVDLQQFFNSSKNMADNVLESGPPSAKRPKLSSPALSVSASDGNGKYIACIFKMEINKLVSTVGV